MIISKNWLDELVETGLTTEQTCDYLTMAGLEVDTASPVCGDISKVVIGKVVECHDHPNSDHLHITKVDIGADALLDIVCGAPNCRAGLKVCVALVGAELPGGVKIKPAKLRGVDSNGMLCSYEELGVNIEEKGIAELPEDAPLGKDVKEYFGWNDTSIDIDLTANRADCLSMLGIAREMAVLTHKEFKNPETAPVAPTISDEVKVAVDAPAACPRYVSRVMKGLNLSAATPLWMKEKLRKCGIRSIDPIVDVTNYVMLELGQLMHAYDLSRIKGQMRVRLAKDGEKAVLLSGNEAVLRNDTLVIADDEKVMCLAGIFGCRDAGVQPDTSDVLLEAAFFAPDAIKERARSYGLATDASHRFERGVDFSLPAKAMERATGLLLAICGGSAGPVCETLNADSLPKPSPIVLRPNILTRTVGVSFTDEQVLTILNSLGIKTEKKDGNYVSVSPSWRYDINDEADLTEEVARIYGYSNIPNCPPTARLLAERTTAELIDADRVKSVLVDRGYHEVVTYSFVEPKKMAVLFPDIKPIIVPKPISAEMSAMRVSVIPGLLEAVGTNNKRGQNRVRIFESGQRFILDKDAENGISQVEMLAGVISGPVSEKNWGIPERESDFYDIKGDVEALIEFTGYGASYEFRAAKCSAYHPGICAEILFNGSHAGWIGQIHPTAQKAYGLKHKVFAFEIELAILQKARIPSFKEISRYQASKRDIALIVPKAVNAADLTSAIASLGGSSLVNIELFDHYEGENLEEGKKSLAFTLTLQNNEKTLSDAEINSTVDGIVAGVREKFGAVLRE